MLLGNRKKLESPNTHLIGLSDARQRVQTPVLVLDLNLLEKNIQIMATFARGNSINLRPHTKTHKSIEIARLQMNAGSIGVCAATLGEAETLARGGIRNILITSPIIGTEKIVRFLKLSENIGEIILVIDNVENFLEIELKARSKSQVVNAVVALDIGTRRIGASSINDAISIVRHINDSPTFAFLGIHAYAGNLQHVGKFIERKKKSELAHKILQELITNLEKMDVRPRLITGAGTGTHEIDGTCGLYTELQTGSYIFMDSEYQSVQITKSRENPFQQSLFVATTVISNNHSGFVTTDAGTKWFSMGGGFPEISLRGPKDSQYRFQGDEHGKIVLPSHQYSPKIGEIFEIIPPHCDPTVNLYEHYHVFRGDTLVDIWDIQARGVI